jgi:hypothetical protein
MKWNGEYCGSHFLLIELCSFEKNYHRAQRSRYPDRVGRERIRWKNGWTRNGGNVVSERMKAQR